MDLIRDDVEKLFYKLLIPSTVGAVLNIFGDWLFVFPLDMGMFGAAFATVLGSLIQLVIMGGYVLGRHSAYQFVKPHNLTTAFRKMITYGFGEGKTSDSHRFALFAPNKRSP